MFSSLSCRADVPSGASGAAAAAAASASIGEQNHDPDYSVLSGVAPCDPALILSIESDFTNIPEWVAPLDLDTYETTSVYSSTDGPHRHVTFYRRDQTVVAIKTLLYLALFDSFGIPSEWHLGPVWFSPKLTESDAPAAMISMIQTGKTELPDASAVCANLFRFDWAAEESYQADLLRSRDATNARQVTELDYHLDSLVLDTPLSACIVKLELDAVSKIRENTKLLAAGSFGVVRADESSVYKASEAGDISSTLRELICLAILTAKGSLHSAALGCIYINEDLSDLTGLFYNQIIDYDAKLSDIKAATSLKTPATILSQQRIDGIPLFDYVSNMRINPFKFMDQTAIDKYKTIILAVLDAIGDVLSKGVIHIDLHLSNVMLSPDGKHAFLIDFGAAGPLQNGNFAGAEIPSLKFIRNKRRAVDVFVKHGKEYPQHAPEATRLVPNKPLTGRTFTYQAAILIAEILCDSNDVTYLVVSGYNPVIRPMYERGYGFQDVVFAAILDSATKLDPVNRTEFSVFKEEITRLFGQDHNPFSLKK